jgi:hypothetical protein
MVVASALVSGWDGYGGNVRYLHNSPLWSPNIHHRQRLFVHESKRTCIHTHRGPIHNLYEQTVSGNVGLLSQSVWI